MTPLRTRFTGLLATLALVAIVAGLPMILLAVGASPIPDSLPSAATIWSTLSSQDDGTLALGFVKVVGWAAWAFLTLSILLEVISRARGIRVPHMPGLRIPQSAARALVSTAMLLFIAVPLSAHNAPAATAAPVPAATAPAVTAAPKPATVNNPRIGVPATRHSSAALGGGAVLTPKTSATPPATVKHTVQRGETLWSIASEHLGAGEKYQEIVVLNTDLLGHRPGFLKPGWVLTLPAANPHSQSGQHTVTVHRGETLSGIALKELGDPARAKEIFEASTATIQPGGAHLRDPNRIDVGWSLTIPAIAPTKAPDPQPGKTEPLPGQNGSAASTHEAPKPRPDAPAPDSTRPAPEARPLAPVQRGQANPPADQHQGPDGATSVEDMPKAPWMLDGLTGAGTILAGSMLLLLRRRRRAQFRARRPGRTIAVPEPVLAPVEKTVTASGSRSAPTLELMDALLRRLAAGQTAAKQDMPNVAAVQLTAGCIVLHLSGAQDLPAPWQGSEDRSRWTWPTGVDVDEGGPPDPDQPAPYPLLVSIGANDNDVWLLNFEDLAVITITGDPTYGRDFARYLAAELACNPWSSQVRVDCVGIAAEIAPMNPQRVRYHDAGADLAAEVLTDAVATIARAANVGHDVTTARAAQLGDETWPSRLLLVDAVAGQTPALTQLVRLIDENPGRTATCVVVNCDHAQTPGVILNLTARGRVSIPHAGLDLAAAGLTSDEAQGCAALLAQSEDLSDVEIPHDRNAESGWRSYSNAAGALRTEHTLRRDTSNDTVDEPAESVLDGPDQEYLTRGATTAEDLNALAPGVPTRVRGEVEDADPTLDADVDAWFADDCDLPRLTLLGPVGARTRGDALAVAKRKAYYIEMLAYLGTHPRGVTPAQLADAFGITPGRARTGVQTVRDWVGVNPRTGEKHLPDARQSTAGRARGVGIYQVDGLLVDANLFRRLRVRGETRGADGITDLCRALTLVVGQPFDQLRTGGWSWLHEGDRLDQHMLCAVVDVAHMVTTSALKNGDLLQARDAAELAALAAPHEEVPRLDLAAVTAAEGHEYEAERILRDDVCNRSDDGEAPMELSERTENIIRNHDWLTPGKTAS